MGRASGFIDNGEGHPKQSKYVLSSLVRSRSNDTCNKLSCYTSEVDVGNICHVENQCLGARSKQDPKFESFKQDHYC